MNVLKAELDKAFSTQRFDIGRLSQQTVNECRKLIRLLTKVNNGCIVLSDPAANITLARSQLHSKNNGAILTGLNTNEKGRNKLWKKHSY